MTPILFYGIPAGCSFGSIVALEWAGQPYRLCRIPMPELAATDLYRRINPLGETPAFLTEQGHVLTESMAIINHIGSSALDTGLAFHQGTWSYDALNRMLAYLNTSFFQSFSTLWYVYEHGCEGTEKEVLQALGRKRVLKAHTDLDRMLVGKRWLLGERKTLADAYFSGIARWADYHDLFDRGAFPRIADLRRRLDDDPAVAFAKAAEAGGEDVGTAAFAGHVTLEEAVALARESPMP